MPKFTLADIQRAGSRVTEYHAPFKAEGTDIRNAFGVIVATTIDEVHAGLFASSATPPDHASTTLAALTLAESFISGFEDDHLQEGIPEMLAGLRAAIQRERARPDLLAVLKLAMTDWPQFDAETLPLSPGCIPEELEAQEVNGGDLVEWFGNWRRAFVLPAIAKAEGRANG